MEQFYNSLNIEALPVKRKHELIKFLAEAILKNRIIISEKHDQYVGYFTRETRKNRGTKVSVRVPLIVLIYANTAWEALVVQKRKFFFVKSVTDTGVYGIATDVR